MLLIIFGIANPNISLLIDFNRADDKVFLGKADYKVINKILIIKSCIKILYNI